MTALIIFLAVWAASFVIMQAAFINSGRFDLFKVSSWSDIKATIFEASPLCIFGALAGVLRYIADWLQAADTFFGKLVFRKEFKQAQEQHRAAKAEFIAQLRAAAQAAEASAAVPKPDTLN